MGRPWAVTLLGAIALAGCSGEGNTGLTTVRADYVAAAPWTYGAVAPTNGARDTVIPAEPVYPPIKYGASDPGSGSADCGPLSGVELAPWMEDFEPGIASDPTQVGLAEAWSSFIDNTKGALFVPGLVNWYPGLTGLLGTSPSRFDTSTWGMPAGRVAGPSCDGKSNEWAMHIRGGQFTEWGAGVVHVLNAAQVSKLHPVDCTSTGALPDVCPPQTPPGAKFDSAGFPVSPPGGAYDPPADHVYWDLSKYDGLAFWARRGPDGQATVLISMTDKFTSDDLNRQNGMYCTRLKRCHSGCENGQPCTLVSGESTQASGQQVYRCFDPATANPLSDSVANDALRDFVYPRCGPAACTAADTYHDPEFDQKACRPYTFVHNESAEYCFNPGDPPPPSKDDRCLDGWGYTAWISGDWKFYMIPFSEMRQGGYGKPAPYFDLQSVYSLTFGFTVGWVDAYFDNVTFYRRKK